MYSLLHIITGGTFVLTKIRKAFFIVEFAAALGNIRILFPFIIFP